MKENTANKHAQVMVVSVGAIALSIFVGGSVAINGVIIGLMSFAAVWSLFTFVKPFQTLVNWKPLLGDALVSVMVYLLIPAKGITAIMAVGTCAVLFTITIRFKKWRSEQKKVQEFLVGFGKEIVKNGAYKEAKGEKIAENEGEFPPDWEK